MTRTHLAMIGDATDPNTFGGIPWHLMRAGQAAGVIDTGLPLVARGRIWSLRRALWTLGRLLRHGERGGYQYGEAFQTRLWAQADIAPEDRLLNLFQLYPQALFDRHPGQKWFYVDQTLTQLFDTYGVGAQIGPRIAADALARERAQYHAAAGVIAQSDWAARDIRMTYGVPADQVHMVLPGANIDPQALAAWEATHVPPVTAPGDPLKLVFVGKEWQRKGLDRLIGAAVIARAQGARVEITTIGIDRATVPQALADAPGVTWAGFIDKRRDLARFLDLVTASDIGCLLSRAEAGGISLREFVRLGLPTLAPLVGGSPEYVLPEASDLIAPQATDADIAAILIARAAEVEARTIRRRAAWAARETASWDHTVRALAKVLQ